MGKVYGAGRLVKELTGSATAPKQTFVAVAARVPSARAPLSFQRRIRSASTIGLASNRFAASPHRRRRGTGRPDARPLVATTMATGSVRASFAPAQTFPRILQLASSCPPRPLEGPTAEPPAVATRRARAPWLGVQARRRLGVAAAGGEPAQPRALPDPGAAVAHPAVSRRRHGARRRFAGGQPQGGRAGGLHAR